MATIRIEKGEPFEKAIKRFKRMLEREGILKTYKDKNRHENDSTKRTRKKREAIRKQVRKNKKLQRKSSVK